MEKIITVYSWSDIACPWCFIGHTNYGLGKEKFLRKYPKVKIKTVLNSYLIDPNTEKNGEDYLAYNKRRWGDDSWTEELKEVGSKVGCTFSNWKTWPNTLLGHTLIVEAEKINKGEEVLHELFVKQYQEGQNVSLEDTLNKVALKFNITNWNTDNNQNSVINCDKYGKSIGIHSVPLFIFDGNIKIEGSGNPDTFCECLEKCLKQ